MRIKINFSAKGFTVLSLVLIIYACNNSNSKKLTGKAVEVKNLMELSNAQQYVEITGSSDKNPVLLFIHGGPGWPQTPMLRYFNAPLTKTFTLATWDQRGSGQSFMNDSNATGLTLVQIVEDAHQFTQYLKDKFKQKKIFIAGFSWGSVVGMELVQKYPQDYIAYAGIAQVINIPEGMKISQQWLYEAATEKGDTITLNTLKKLKHGDTSLCNRPMDCFIKQYELISKYNGAVYNKASETEVEKAVQFYSDYKLYDWLKGFEYSAYRLEKDMFAVDYSKLAELKIPAYFFLGRHDWNIPSALTEKFVNKLKAPHKEIIWFENSAHGPLEEEPVLFNKLLAEKLISNQ